MQNFTNDDGVMTNMTDSNTEDTWSFIPSSVDEAIPHYREGTLFEDATLEASRYSQVDYEMAVSSALGVVAACCQGLVDVAFPNGHTVPTSLMIMTLAGVSEGKTSLDAEFSRPIREFEKDHDRRRRELIKNYQRDLDIWKRKEKVLNKALEKHYANGEDTENVRNQLHELDDEKPLPPLSYRFIYERATPSALLYSMYENIPLAYFLSDEAGSLLMGPAFDDICQFNSLWSGSDISVDRRTSDSFLLSDARLSANLMLQPAIFERFIHHKRGRQAYDSGFFARFLISYPKPQTSTKLRERSSHDAMKRFHERALQRLEESIERCQKQQPRTVLKFTGSAKDTWNRIYASIMKETYNGRAYMVETGHAKKLIDNISRIAALLHIFHKDDYTQQDISKNDLLYAANLVCHFSGHYMRHLAQEPEIVTLTNSMIITIRKHAKEKYESHGSDTISSYIFNRSNIQQHSTGKLRYLDPFLKVLEFLRDLGHVKIDKHKRGQHEFSETILLHGAKQPRYRNGEIYYVRELPRFSAHKTITPAGGVPQYVLKPTEETFNNTSYSNENI